MPRDIILSLTQKGGCTACTLLLWPLRPLLPLVYASWLYATLSRARESFALVTSRIPFGCTLKLNALFRVYTS